MDAVGKKGIIRAFIAVGVIAGLTISFLAYYLYFVISGNKFESNYKYYLEGASSVHEDDVGVLVPGMYFMNGDTDSLYYEVFDDGTMQLAGGELSDFLPERDAFKEFGRERDCEWRERIYHMDSCFHPQGFV